ncbi:MAG: LysM peptidoglycan-binding domain-containing protein [Clostridia bacterium]|nr:LysM peptidoglycan-binding domain-containing protein [Clostridia bacterium]
MLEKKQGELKFDKSFVLGQKQTAVKFRMFCKEDNVESVLSMDILPILDSFTIQDGGVDFFGKITTKLLVKEQNGAIGGMSYTVDVSDKFKHELLTKDSVLTATMEVVEQETTVEGAEVTVNLVVDTQFRLYQNLTTPLLEGGNIECCYANVDYGKVKGQIDNQFNVNTELEINDDIARVLSSQSNAIIRQASIDNKILTINGQVVVGLTYLPTDSDIPKSVLLPFDFSQEIEVEQNGNPMIDLITKSTKIRLEVFEDQKNSVFSVDVAIVAKGVIVLNDTQAVVTDCYSTSSFLTTTNTTVETTLVKGFFAIEEEISDEILVDTQSDCQYCGLFSCAVTILKAQAKQGVINLSGVINGYFIFKTPQGYVSQKAEYPFETNLEQKVDIGDIVEAVGWVVSVDTSKSDDAIKSKFGVVFNLKVWQNKTLTFVSDFLDGEPILDTNAIEVSIAFKGDSLWDVAKNLNMSVEEVKKLNPNLTDPLEEDQKLLIYHQIK